MKKTIGILLASSLALTSCIPIIASALILSGSKSKGQRQEFIAQLQRTNMEREASGLKPLDWCSEAYRFDRGWAVSDPACEKRVLAYEDGDVVALDNPIVVVADSVVAAQP